MKWRTLLLGLWLFAVGVSVVSTWEFATSYFGYLELYAVPSGTPFVDRVAFVKRGGPAQVAGIRVGDLVDTRAMSPPQRYQWEMPAFHNGERFNVPVVREGRTREVRVVARDRPTRLDTWLAIASELCMLAFVGLIAWRRSEMAEARVFVLILTLFVVQIALAPNNFETAWPGVNLWANVMSNVFGAGLALLATYASLFARPISPLRRSLEWVTYALAAVSTVWGVLGAICAWTGWADPKGLVNPMGPLPQIANALLAFTAVLCALTAFLSARGRERSRIAWALPSIAFMYLTTGVATVLYAIDPGLGMASLATKIGNASIFIAPFGLAYSLLNRRLLDIGFAINRAAVFTGVSVIVVGVFVLVEWGLGEWLNGANHNANIAVSAGLALMLGLSIRFIHARVDHFVDNVFFRKRHEDEKALRKFAHEASYITSRQVLLERAIRTVEAHADASFASIVLDDGSGTYSGVPENDPALVSLRAWRKPLDLHEAGSALHGEFAFPMVARGYLLGALVVGPKRSGESYAPDESDAIAALAHGVGTALDALAIRGADSQDALLDAIRSLPDAIVKRLQSQSLNVSP